MAPRDENQPDENEFNRRPRVNQIEEIPDEIPEWVKVDNIEEFKRLCEVHCGNDEDEIRVMIEIRRKIKNREEALRMRERRLQEQQQ